MTTEDIVRGPLTKEEKDLIETLFTTLKKPTVSRIAQRLKRSRSTIRWHMVSNGMIKGDQITYRRKPHQRRDGSVVRPFSEAEDRMIVMLRRQRKFFREIAAALNAAFDTGRTAHTTHVRMTMLSAYRGSPEMEMGSIAA